MGGRTSREHAMGELQPRMRAGDKDRQGVVEQLGRHFAEGRLTVEEFDERVVRAHAAVHLDELPVLTADLPRAPEPQRRPARQSAHVPGAFVFLVAMFMTWSVVAAVSYGTPPVFLVLLLFLVLRHRRWSRHW
jgi:hypothetical protein